MLQTIMMLFHCTKLRDGWNQFHNLMHSRCIILEGVWLIPMTIFCLHTDRNFALKNWFWNLFTHVLNLYFVAAYKFYSLASPNQKMSYLQDKIEVTKTLLTLQTNRTLLGGPSCTPVSLVWFDGINHFLESCKQGRYVKCQKNTRLNYAKCNKRLHKDCSDIYHKQW